MADIPDTIVLKRDRDLAKRAKELWFRRIFMALLFALLIAALLNVFGQRATTSETVAPAATLTIRSPSTLRSGLIFQTRLRILASQEIKHAVVVLSPGWLEGITLNTMEPSALGEASKDGLLSLDLGHIRQGQTYTLYLQMQVNPTTFGTRTQQTSLFDGETLLLTTKRDVTIFP